MKPYHWKKKRLLVEPVTSLSKKMSTASLPSLTLSNLRKIDDPNHPPVISPELEKMSDSSSGRSTASVGSITGQDSPGQECQRVHCQSLELQLEANTVENMILKEDNLKLKERLDKVEAELRNKDQQVKGLTEVKEAVKKLYSVGEAVLAAMDGRDVIEERSYDKVEDTILVDRLCSDLQDKLLEWQGNHQRLHDNLEEVVRVTNSLADELLGRTAPMENGVKEENVSSEPVVGSSSSTRRNPLRRCRQAPRIQSACGQHQQVASQFACDHCAGTFCRLGHVREKLDFVKSLSLVPRDNPEGTPPRADSTPPTEEMDQDDQSTTSVKIEAKTEALEGSNGRLPFVKLDHTGQEHKFAGARKIILPQEQVKLMVEGCAPVKQKRFFCLCGRHYPNHSALYNHIKFMGRSGSSNFKCGLCEEGFNIRTGMKLHLKTSHRVDYSNGRFACMECGEDFSTVKEVGGHQRLAHENDDDDDEEEEERGNEVNGVVK